MTPMVGRDFNSSNARWPKRTNRGKASSGAGKDVGEKMMAGRSDAGTNGSWSLIRVFVFSEREREKKRVTVIS